jgi:uncharacterized protein (DUF4415 family)
MSAKSTHKPSGTDWERLRTLRDEDIAFDEDSPHTSPGDWEGAKITLRGQEMGRVRLQAPSKAPPKVATTLRLPPEVLAYFKATGPGWQTRIGEALKEWIQTHPPIG